MKRFGVPRMTMVYLSGDNIITASGDCNTQTCGDYTCPECLEPGCNVVTPCIQYHCQGVLCPQYTG